MDIYGYINTHILNIRYCKNIYEENIYEYEENQIFKTIQ